MYELRTKRRMRRVLYGPWVILALGGVFVLTAFSAWDMREKALEARAKRDDAARELHALEQRKVEVAQDVTRLTSERGMEGEIREKYMVAKEGEKVMIITDSMKESQQEDAGFVPDPPSRWEQFQKAIGL